MADSRTALFVANRTAWWWLGVLPVGQLVSGVTALPGGGLGEADAVAGGDDDVGVVEEPVDGGVGDGLGHEFVEPGGVKVARPGRWSVSRKRRRRPGRAPRRSRW